uniref:Putative ovule protein n=1 Tax=Solanum chacoense TaxID=4108 RepID=A0A0V0H7A2_SOLCH
MEFLSVISALKCSIVVYWFWGVQRKNFSTILFGRMVFWVWLCMTKDRFTSRIENLLGFMELLAVISAS